MSIGQTMLSPLLSFLKLYNNTTLDLRFVVSKVRGFIYIQWLATVDVLRYLYQQVSNMIFGYMIICVETVLDNTTNQFQDRTVSCWQ